MPEIAAVGEWSRDLHARYTLSSVPSAFAERLIAILVWCADGWRLALGVLILAAALHASGVERAGVATIALLLLAYLTFAHPPMWIVYYLEVLPIFYFLAARELGRLLHKFSGLGARSQRSAGRRRWPTRRWRSRSCCCRSARTTCAASARRSIFETPSTAPPTPRSRALPPEKAIVFVSYPPAQSPHVALTRNEPDLASALRWVVYDRGPRNAELRALAPDRAAYRLDAATMRMERLP